MVALELEAAEAAVLGGVFFGAGGGGTERGMRSARQVCELGRPSLVTLDELHDGDIILITTGIGAPGVHRRSRPVWPRHRLRAVQMVREALGPGQPVKAVMVSHPGGWMPESWIAAALDPGISVLDCAANGRGHPVVTMGGMGLADRGDVSVVQAGAAGPTDDGSALEIVVKGALTPTSKVMRGAAVAAGGGIAAARGPFTAGFCREFGAPGAVSAAIALGRELTRARQSGAAAVIETAVALLGGRELGRGEVTATDVAFQVGFDVGRIEVTTPSGRIELAVCNEYMAAQAEGTRLSTFPDLIVTLSAETGMPTAAASAVPGSSIVVVSVPADRIALGAGVWDRSAYQQPEQLLGLDLWDAASRMTRHQEGQPR